MSDVTWFAILSAAGLAGGFMAGLLGIGGGIILVPVLFHLLSWQGVAQDLAMKMALATSLANIVPTSIMAARTHYQHGLLRVDILKFWAPLLVCGAVLGAVLAGFMSAGSLKTIFVVMLLLIAANLALVSDASIKQIFPITGMAGRLLAFTIGTISTVMGIGGGSLTVPAMRFCGLTIKEAVATASSMGLLIALPGVLSYMVSGLGVMNRPSWSVGYVDFFALIGLMPTGLLAAKWGARVSQKISGVVLRGIFACFLCVVVLSFLFK
ncbi:MAG: sulfite exporter TauE/SafE family protein [Alphaproteobacteria bacterium]